MKKGSFGQYLAVFLVVIGILYVIGTISEASEPKCIKAGCDNKQATGSSYCYLHKPYTGSSSYKSSSKSSSSSYSSGKSSSSSYSGTSSNKKAEQQEVLLRATHLAVRHIRAIHQVKRVVHITPMMMDMIQFTMMEIMIMTDTTVTQIMQMA